jgi:hypothetical protein
MQSPTNDAEASSNSMESRSNDRNQTGLRISSADQAEASIQTDTIVRNGQRRQRMSGAMRRKTAKRTCFPASMEVMTHSSSPLGADPSNAVGNLARETSPVTNRENPPTDGNPIPCRPFFLPPGPSMETDDKPTSYKPPSPQPVTTALARLLPHNDTSVDRPIYKPLQHMRQSRSDTPQPFIPIAASTDNTNQAPTSGCGGGVAPVSTIVLGETLMEADTLSHDDGKFDLYNNRDDDTPSREEKRVVLRANLECIRQSISAVLRANLERIRQSISGRPRPFLPEVASTDNTNEAPANGCGDGTAFVPAADLKAIPKEAELFSHDAVESDLDKRKEHIAATTRNPPPPSKAAVKKPQTERAKKAGKRRDGKHLTRFFSNDPSDMKVMAITPKVTADMEAASNLPASERYSRMGVPIDGRRIEGRCPNCEWDGRADNAPSKVHLLADLEPPTFQLDGIVYVDYNHEWPSSCRSSWNQQRRHHERVHAEIAREDWPFALRDRQSRRGLELTKEEKKERRRVAQRKVRAHKKEVDQKEERLKRENNADAVRYDYDYDYNDDPVVPKDDSGGKDKEDGGPPQDI